MPRAKRAAPPTLEPDDRFALPGMELDADPVPAELPRQRRTPTKRAVGRPRSATPRSSSSRVPSKTAQVAQVRTEVETYLTLINAAWSLRDPDCADVADAAIAPVADRVASMIGRNDAVLAFMSKSGILGDVVGLLTALTPVARAVWQAHGPNGHRHGKADQDEGGSDATTFPAYSSHAR